MSPTSELPVLTSESTFCLMQIKKASKVINLTSFNIISNKLFIKTLKPFLISHA